MPNSRFVFHTSLLFLFFLQTSVWVPADWSDTACWLAEASAEAGVLFPRRSAAEKEENEKEEQHKFLYWEALVC